MARLAVGMLLQVILILLLRLPEGSSRDDLGHDLPGPQAGCIDVSDGVEGGESLLLGQVEDRRADVSPHFVALSVQRRRIMDLEEELQKSSVRGEIGVESDFDRL